MQLTWQIKVALVYSCSGNNVDLPVEKCTLQENYNESVDLSAILNGYYAWILSCLLACIANVYLVRHRDARTTSEVQ